MFVLFDFQMNWLNNFLSSNNVNELKPIFGQEYLCASGYDDARETLHYKDDPNIRETNNRTDLKINIEIASSFEDYHKFSEVFGLKRFEFLKFIANRSNGMEEILQFLNKNINGYTMICNIYMVKKEATVDYKSKSKHVTRHISKFLLGHHIILCVPLAGPFYDLLTAKEILSKLILRNSEGTFADYFLPDSVALIDYTDTLKKPAFEILSELADYKFSNNISLFVELPKLEKITTYNNFSAERAALLTILKLKKLNYLMEEKFAFETNFVLGKNSMGMEERNKIAEIAVLNMRKLGDLDVSSFPPPNLIVLYSNCKVYERGYLLSLYENNFVPTLYPKLEENIDIAYRTIKNMPLKNVENVWLLRVNDGNANEIYQKYLSGKWCIVITKDTKHLVTEFLKGTVIWVLTQETKWQESTEPVLIYNGVDEYLLGMATPQQTNNKTCKNGVIFRCPCICKNDKGIIKAWICTKCKYLFRTADDTHVYCGCGVYNFGKIDRWCFKCSLREAENPIAKTPEEEIATLIKEKSLSLISVKNGRERPSSLSPTPTTPTAPSLSLISVKNERGRPPSVPPTPTTPTAPPTPKVMTPTAETTTPKHIIPIKKNFNILFIGQSGAGKSMLVNSIYNYLKYDFEEVSKAETVDCILPCQFQLQTPDFKKIVFKAGPEDKNENFNDNGESVTQHPKVYSFKTEQYHCQVIDTPGLGDTRGAKQDEHNLNLIRNAIIEIKELHSICFVMPSNISKLTSNFEVHMRDLLSLFPKTALKNVFFFFTYANSTFFNIGDTRNTLEEFISTFKETNNAEIPFGMENVCCVDSEAFMYFIATNQGHKYQNRDLESFRVSWNKSKEAVETFLVKIENVKPIKSDDLLMTYELEQIGTMLRKENNNQLKVLIQEVLTTISQISMTSKFNLAKKPSVEPMNESQRPGLFQALEICQEHVVNPNLKQLIQKLVEAYGQKTVVKNAEKMGQPNGTNIKRSSIEKDTENGFKPDPPKRVSSDWPCLKRLKEIAERLGIEWQNGKISINLMEDMLNVQIAGNLQQRDINKQKLKDSLDMLLMEFNGEFYDIVRNFNDEY